MSDLTDAEALYLRWILGEGPADEPPRGSDMGDLIGKGYVEYAGPGDSGLGRYRVTAKGRAHFVIPHCGCCGQPLARGHRHAQPQRTA